MAETSIVRVKELDLRLSDESWPFADTRRAEIDAHFAELNRQNPALWNGRVLLSSAFSVDDGVARGTYFETDFASFITWRDWGFPDARVRNCFAMGALQAEDGAFLLGVMGEHTSNPGWIYFPAGTPDPDDVLPDGCVDLAGSALRELEEETGIPAHEVVPATEWSAVIVEPRIALTQVVRVRGRADDLRERILKNLAAEERPELSDIHIARGPGDIHPKMPLWTTAFLHHVWDNPS
jgi:8-oxo-dGTP pyrophosphatase MutT (NUDIX family)